MYFVHILLCTLSYLIFGLRKKINTECMSAAYLHLNFNHVFHYRKCIVKTNLVGEIELSKHSTSYTTCVRVRSFSHLKEQHLCYAASMLWSPREKDVVYRYFGGALIPRPTNQENALPHHGVLVFIFLLL
jgi:hypothetical protein